MRLNCNLCKALLGSLSDRRTVHVEREVISSDYGAGTKEQIQELVRLQLGQSEVPQPADAADALAVAICHLYERRLERLLAGK